MHHRLLALHEAARAKDTIRQIRRATQIETPVFDSVRLFTLPEWARLRTNAATHWETAGRSALLSDRRRDRSLLQQWMMRRPAAAVPRRVITHRTVFNKTPRESLRHM